MNPFFSIFVYIFFIVAEIIIIVCIFDKLIQSEIFISFEWQNLKRRRDLLHFLLFIYKILLQKYHWTIAVLNTFKSYKILNIRFDD